MRWSFRIGRVAGIPIQVHVTFFLLVLWIARGFFTGEPRRALMQVVLLLLVFACVVLHELGHALAARRYGIRTRDITLLPIGGVARLERMPQKPSQELVVALAGPAVNVVIATVLSLVAGGFPRPTEELLNDPSLLQSMIVVNVWMLLFNLVPAFPMDGGRVLRALLAIRLPFARATQIASGIGQVVAVAFALIGVIAQQPLLMFVALFVFLAAGEERAMAVTRATIEGLPVRDAMITEFHALDASDRLDLAVRHLMAGNQTEFPVLEGRQPVGVLASTTLIEALSRVGPAAAVGTVVKRGQDWCDADEPLDDVLMRVRETGRSAIPVMSGGALVGLLTLQNVGELLLVRGAIRRFQGHAQG